MVSLRDVKLEFRDGANGLEARLLRGKDDGWEERVSWSAVDLSPDLLAAARELRRAGLEPNALEQGLLKHGRALWTGLGPFQNELRAVFEHAGGEAIDSPHRMVVALGPPSEQDGHQGLRARDLQELCWQALGTYRGHGRGDLGVGPFLGGNMSLLVLFPPDSKLPDGAPAERIPLKTLRLLVLISSLEHEDSNLRTSLVKAANTLVESVRTSLANVAGVEVVVAAPSCYANLGFQPDLTFLEEPGLAHVLRHASNPGKARRDIHAILTFGHSDAGARGEPLATGLRFSFGSQDPEETVIPAKRLSEWLKEQPLQLFVAANCATLGLAPHLLECAPHVVVTSALVDANDQGGLAARLVQHLAEGSTTGDALKEAIAETPAGQSRLIANSQTVHFANSVHDRPFLSPLDVELAKYYEEKVIQDHKTIRNAFGDGRQANLKLVYVELDLSREGERSPGSKAASQGASDEREGPITFPQLLQKLELRVVLVGGAGSGKTTVLRHYTVAYNARERADGALPVYVSLPLLVKSAAWARSSNAEDVFESIRSFLGRQKTTFEEALRARKHEVVFLFDGLDELPEDSRGLVIEGLRSLARNWPEARFVVAARETADVSSLTDAGWRTARVRPLNEDQQRQLLRNWFESVGERSREQADGEAKRWTSEIRNRGGRLAEMATNPLLLTYVAELALSGKKVEDLDRGRHLLVADILTRFCSRNYQQRPSHRQAPPIVEPTYLRHALRWVAWRMLCERTRTLVDLEELKKVLEDGEYRADHDRVRKAIKSLGEKVGSFADLAYVLAEQSGVLHAEWGDEGDWKFKHNLLQEALAAEYWWYHVLEEKKKPDAVVAWLRKQVEQSPTDALDFWSETTALLAGWMQDDGLLLPLLEDGATLDLGLRILHVLDRVQPSTWQGVLEVLPQWNFDIERARQGEKGPRVQAYEVLASQAIGYDEAGVGAVLDTLEKRSGQLLD